MGNSIAKNNTVVPSPTTSIHSENLKAVQKVKKTLAKTNTAKEFIDFLKTSDMTQLSNLLESVDEVIGMDIIDCESVAASFQRIFLKETEASRILHSSQRGFAQAMGKSDPRSLVLLLLFAQLQQHSQIVEQEKKKKQQEKNKRKVKEEETNKIDALKSDGEVKPAEVVGSSETILSLSPSEDEEQLSRHILASALESIDEVERDRLFTTGPWLANLLVAVETLPVCVSIASASPSRPGFPLIYVNGCFETTTGYTKGEIIGQNCRFLQAGKAEPESIQRLSIALRDAKPVKVSITNYRKDGMPFRNLLAMKPIFDENGVYRYVVGIQFDVTAEDATPQRLKMTDELMRMLPDVIPIQDIDEEL